MFTTSKRGHDATPLRAVPLFERCDDDELKRVASMCVPAEYPAGETVIQAGTPGDAFYVIVRGVVGVIIGGRAVAALGPNDFFGDSALMVNAPRSATVVARTPLQLLRFDRAQFAQLLGIEAVRRQLLHEKEERSAERRGEPPRTSNVE